MKFALVNSERQEAQPKLIGSCLSCGSPTVARCGEIRINHWAHKGQKRCDPWWENETEWHRTWKNQFPTKCQEFIQQAENGEKHVADVRTDAGWVLEFQHSYISAHERRSREGFYSQLIWIVDGTRRVKDQKRFFEVLGEQGFNRKHPELIATFPEGALFRDWIASTAHVLIDFGEDQLWWLMPQSNEYWAYVLPIRRSDFIDLHHRESHDWMRLIDKYHQILAQRQSS